MLRLNNHQFQHVHVFLVTNPNYTNLTKLFQHKTKESSKMSNRTNTTNLFKTKTKQDKNKTRQKSNVEFDKRDKTILRRKQRKTNFNLTNTTKN